MASRLTERSFLWPDHLDMLSHRLADVYGGKSARLIVTMPPRHGKSELISHWFPVWLLALKPSVRVILSSYEADFASMWGRKVRNTLTLYSEELGVDVADDSAAANRWETHAGGGMVTAGVGGPITGRGADVMIVDDPVKNAEEANSQVMRDRAWEWWQTTAYTRLEPGGSAIVVQTRWHEDDLAGRLIANQQNEKWDVINLPALAEDNDALGRKPGEALWPDRYSSEALQSIRSAVGSRAFAALYQQRPSAATGTMFKREYFRYASDDGVWYTLKQPNGSVKKVLKSDCWRFASADTAMTEGTQSDYTVRQVWDVVKGTTTEGKEIASAMILVDQWRERRETPKVEDEFRQTLIRWKPIFIGLEGISDGLTILQRMQRDNLPVRRIKYGEKWTIPDKVTKATLAEIWMSQGKVYFLEGAPYIDVLEAELLGFPVGTHDDQVDAISIGVHFANNRDLWLAPPPPKDIPGTMGAIAGHAEAFNPKPQLPDPFRSARR